MSRVAAVDCGTNSTRLLIAERGLNGSGPVAPVLRTTRVTRLGRGVDATGCFDEAALADTLAVLNDFVGTWTSLGVTAVGITATSAVRDVSDPAPFIHGVRDCTGMDVQVLTGAQEAALAFRGATLHVEDPQPTLVLDIGGGSTEFIFGESDVCAWASRQLGCVRLTERYLAGDPPAASEYAAAHEAIATELDAVQDLVPAGDARALVGVAGTLTTLAALHLGLDDPDAASVHGTRLSIDVVRQLVEHLAWQTSASRARHGAIAVGREDVIVAGGLILAATMERFCLDEVLVSEADLLDALAFDLLVNDDRSPR